MMLHNNPDLTRHLHSPEKLLTHLRLVSHKMTLANSVDPDHMPQNVASDLGLHCLH